jgi:hypothetical protein
MNEGDELLADEPGRCGHGLDSHSYHFRLVKHHGGFFLLVKHGAGCERMRFGYQFSVDAVLALDSDTRYSLLSDIYHAISYTRQDAVLAEAHRWRRAAAEKRIRVRKVRGSDAVKVTIQPAALATV